MTETSPFAALQQIAGGYALARCLHVVADLGVADVLDGAARTAADLASDVGAHADALGRVLQLLAAHGVFAVRGEAFSALPMSTVLITLLSASSAQFTTQGVDAERTPYV